MATTLLPIDPAVSPQRVNRILTISASLLPEEVTSARRARRAGILVAVVVALVAGLCAAWFAVAYQQTQAAERDLEAASVEVTNQQRQQAEYSDTVRVQERIKTLDSQLKAAMANDLDWDALLDTVRNTGKRSGITVEGVNGKLNATDGSDAKDSSTLPGSSNGTSVGSIVVTGTGKDKRAVAAYADALAKETTVTNPYVTVVATQEEGDKKVVSFSLTADITEAALCGRFTEKCPGGK
ncbi:PilN domain-containing protein [Actinoplanes sp. NPDC049118]|uniref:PilN domain-containing protein n=1 Tax=Actinoplanes sp. NPDC049118 TaxID=3155769 RepID=UPI0033DB4BF4